jgi:hypothetical protein
VADAELPPLIRSHLDRVLVDPGATPGLIRITQSGEMFRRPGGRPLEFKAVQELSVRSVDFEWRAAFGANPLVRLSVVDRFQDGEGLLAVKVWGLVPVTHSSGPDTDRSEAMRYLAELPWVPFAISANRELAWRPLDENDVEVATVVAGKRPAVRLALDADGLIRRASAVRPRLAGGEFVETPWVGEFGDYVELGGIRVPRTAEVRWELPDGPFTYWRCEVASLVAE